MCFPQERFASGNKDFPPCIAERAAGKGLPTMHLGKPLLIAFRAIRAPVEESRKFLQEEALDWVTLANS